MARVEHKIGLVSCESLLHQRLETDEIIYQLENITADATVVPEVYFIF